MSDDPMEDVRAALRGELAEEWASLENLTFTKREAGPAIGSTLTATYAAPGHHFSSVNVWNGLDGTTYRLRIEEDWALDIHRRGELRMLTALAMVTSLPSRPENEPLDRSTLGDIDRLLEGVQPAITRAYFVGNRQNFDRFVADGHKTLVSTSMVWLEPEQARAYLQKCSEQTEAAVYELRLQGTWETDAEAHAGAQDGAHFLRQDGVLVGKHNF